MKPSPACVVPPYTLNDDTALIPTFRMFAVSVLMKPVVPVKLNVEKEETFRTAKVLPNCVER